MAIADIPRRALSARERAEASDADLVEAVTAGDTVAFGELYRRHFLSVQRVCSRRAPSAADDIAQAAFLRALDRIDQCRGDRRFGAWVQTIAMRMCTDHARSNARVAENDWDFDRFATERAAAMPEHAALASEQRRHLVEALSALPSRQRDVLRQRDIDERRPAEIAAALGLSVGAVDSVLLRARRRVGETYRALSADTGASTIGTTTGTAVTSAGALGHSQVFGFMARVANGVAGAARELAARVVTSPFGSLVTSPRPGLSVAAAALAVGAFTGGGHGTAPSVSPPLDVPSVEVSVPLPAGNPSLPSVPEASIPTVPPAPAPPSAPAAPALPEQPQPTPPETPHLPSPADVSDDLLAGVEAVLESLGVPDLGEIER